jgi:hypothetical protein
MLRKRFKPIAQEADNYSGDERDRSGRRSHALELVVSPHGDVFRSYSLRGAIQFSIDGNSVAICMEPVTAESMESDGVIRETVKFYFLDRDLKL